MVMEKNPTEGEVADPCVEPEVGSACPTAAKDTAVPGQSGQEVKPVIKLIYDSPGVSSSVLLPVLYKWVSGACCPILKPTV